MEIKRSPTRYVRKITQSRNASHKIIEKLIKAKKLHPYKINPEQKLSEDDLGFFEIIYLGRHFIIKNPPKKSRGIKSGDLEGH